MNGEPTPTHATQLRNHWWWRPGWNPDRRFYTWHLTFEGQDQLHQLVSTYQDALSTVPGLDLIPLEWLHLTMQGVGFTDEVSPDDAHAIAAAVAARLATLPPVELTFHRPAIRPEAIALSTDAPGATGYHPRLHQRWASRRYGATTECPRPATSSNHT